MISEASQRLNDLVTDYYHGLLTRESYRRARGRLLDALANGAAAGGGAGIDEAAGGAEDTTPRAARRVDVTAPRPPASSHAADQDEGDGDTVEIKIPVARRSSPAPSRKAAVAASAVVVIGVAAAAAWWLWSRGAPPAEPAAAGAAPADAASPADALFAGFTEEAAWPEAEVEALQSRWQTLTGPERQSVRLTGQYRDFSRWLLQRLNRELAVSENDPTSLLLALLGLAETMEQSYAPGIRARLSALPTPRADAGATPAPVTPDSSDSPPQPVSAAPDVAQPPDAEPAAAGRPVPADDDRGPPAPEPIDAGDTVADDSAAAGAVAAAAAVTAAEADATAPAPGDAAVDARDDPCRNSRTACRDRLVDGSAGPSLSIIVPGSYSMGSDLRDEESPVHRVTIAAPFAMSINEISVVEFNTFCTAAGHPCPVLVWSGGDYPVHNVSWHDAVAYAEWLTEQTGFTYRLPSEAQWEYAARAGTETPYFFGDRITQSNARSSEYGRIESPVPSTDSTINRNAFRLMHMAGNVREWVQDPWHPDYVDAPADGSVWAGGDSTQRVVRGGSFSDLGFKLRSAAREPVEAGHRDQETGFRVARVIDP